MTVAAIFAFLLAAGVCAPTAFHGSDGSRLEVLVCPRNVAPDVAPDLALPEPALPGDEAPADEPPPAGPQKRT